MDKLKLALPDIENISKEANDIFDRIFHKKYTKQELTAEEEMVLSFSPKLLQTLSYIRDNLKEDEE